MTPQWRGAHPNAAGRHGDLGPFCECGYCDATGRDGGPEIRLPVEAWAVAGEGDLDRLAVLPGHEQKYRKVGGFTIEGQAHDGWLAVGTEKP